MRSYYIAAVCALTMLLACCLAPIRSTSLAGTWVQYAGDDLTYAILRFEADGTGEGYSLPSDYPEVWLQGEPVPNELLVDPMPFQWLTTGDETDQLELTFEDGSTQSFVLAFEEDLDGTSLPGISLTDDLNGGGWVQAPENE